MKTTWKQFSLLAALLIPVSQSGCSAQSLLNPGEVGNSSLQLTRQESPDAVTTFYDTSTDQTRASVARIQFEYPNVHCTYLYSPTDFCDTVHINAYRDALESKPINFANGLILLDIPTRPDYFQKSLVVIEPDTGIVWPFPFDAYSGPIDEDGNSIGDGKLEYSLDSSRVCIEGTLLVYRVLETGRFCFTFDGGRFEGHVTAYTQDADD